ncbi:probable polygalacturonase isoform X2 [Corylus avellana]|uniref:probable polygalacturonase isoform X2 n=1 Tax=Corylus avellana TaxID=13451 RepID=UPI00286B580B|nr:probable polygalacturonase isoform X2 [Corylus avellana]
MQNSCKYSPQTMEPCLRFRTSHLIQTISAILILGVAECTVKLSSTLQYPAINCRKHSAVLTEFGAVGDGKTSNTKAFKAAIDSLSKHASDGGALLIVPPGKWLTGSFNLTSHFTLFLHKDALLLGSTDESEFPQLPPLPSYGTTIRRFTSLIFGTNLTDVVITGNNGTIDGQGATWWTKYPSGGLLNVTRPCMIELMYSNQIQISNLILINSPYSFVHPVYSSDILIQGLTILAPIDSPNTHGIQPDSCTNTRIEDCFIEPGDDCIFVKSGYDQYGIRFGMPSKQLVIRRLTCISPDNAIISLGSEMSGGIQDVRIEDITAFNMEAGLRIKTAIGRGGFVKDIYVRRLTMKTTKYVFWISGDYNKHPDNGFDPKALPEIHGINYRDVVAENVNVSAKFDGITNDVFTGICISNVNITLSQTPKALQWNCSNIAGVTSNVTPKPCNLLPEQKGVVCHFPEDKLPIEHVQLKACSATTA